MTPKSEAGAAASGTRAGRAQRGPRRKGASAVADPTAREFLAVSYLFASEYEKGT
jgi:hypothetical protein